MLEVVLAVRRSLPLPRPLSTKPRLMRVYDLSDGERHPHKWGYTDTRFEFDGPKDRAGDRQPLSAGRLHHAALHSLCRRDASGPD